MRRHPRSAVICVLALLVGTFGCSNENKEAPGQLVVSFTTDLEVPKDINKLGVEVWSGGNQQYGNEFALGPQQQRLPATLTIVAGKDPAEPVTIKAFSRKDGVAKTFREIITTVPADRIAVLHVGIQWLCWNQVGDATSGFTPVSLCENGQTCIAGTCADPGVDSTALEDYSEAAIFGGAPQGGEGTCFDAVGCFSTGTVVEPDGECTIEDPGGDVNVAFVLPPDGPGIRGAEANVVPLDGNSPEGWQRSDGRITLPPAACQRPGSAIAITTDCATKTPGIPTCGEWSAVSGNAQIDLGAPEGYQIPTGDAGAGDAGAL